MRTVAKAARAIAVIACISVSVSAASGETSGRGTRQVEAGGLALQVDGDVSSHSLEDLYNGESVYFLARLIPGSRLAGRDHRLDYRWYAGDALELQFGGTQKLPIPPAAFWAVVHPGHFAPGPHKAVLLIDGAAVDEHPFLVHAESRPLDKQVSLEPKAKEITPSDQSVRDSITEQARSWLMTGNTDAFDEAAKRFRVSRERTPAGYWKLAALYHVANDLHESDGGAKLWDELDELCVRWLERRPESIAAIIVRAKLMLARAWVERGTDYAAGVKARQMDLFTAHVEAARQLLDANAGVAAQDPEWDALRITVAMAQGASSREILQRADAALARQPLYYGIHFAAEKALEPQWGGSESWIKRYVTLAMERSRSLEGSQAYVRIYFNVAKNARQLTNELNLTGAKLPQMIASYEDVLRAYPDPHNVEVARALMCSAGDGGRYRALGRRGKDVVPPLAWWDSLDWRQGCDRWAFEGVMAPAPIADRVSTVITFFQGFGDPFWRGEALVALLLWLVMEWFLTIRPRGAGLSSQHLVLDPYDPERYPRTYHAYWDRTNLSNRSAVRFTVLGFTLAWAVSTVPWPDRVFGGTIFAICLGLGLGGLYILVFRLSGRVYLMSDAVEVRNLWSRQRLKRESIMARSPFSAGTPSVVLYPHRGMGIALQIPSVRNADDTFWRWFGSFKEVVRPPDN